jgi:hypothetical protein
MAISNIEQSAQRDLLTHSGGAASLSSPSFPNLGSAFSDGLVVTTGVLFYPWL